MAKPRKHNKGQMSLKPDTDDPEKNPLLHVENKEGFSIETSNMLEQPDILIFSGYDNFDLTLDKDHFDLERLTPDSDIVVVLRYYEYICISRCKFSYILPMLESGLIAKDVFDMIKHSLKTKLMINIPSFDVIFEPEIKYVGKIKY